MIVSTHTKTVVNCSTTFLVRPYTSNPRIITHIRPTDSDGPVKLELPEQWLWDIIDEFIYQFQAFCTWRSKVKSKTDEEIGILSEGAGVRTIPNCNRGTC